MNFQKLIPIQKKDELLETAFSKAKKVSKRKTNRSQPDRLRAAYLTEVDKVGQFSKYLIESLNKISKSYPSFDNLSEFYTELIGTVQDIDEIRKSLSSINWSADKIREFTSLQKKNFARAKTYENLMKEKKAYYGRISSILSRVEKHLKFIEKTRSKLKKLPDVKENMFTVCIAGFPNVGKSTLLSKITNSKPEINSYAFTTKGLNTGYFMNRTEKIQVIDTPGTLARFNKMNNIEKQAYLAVKYCADVIIFVFDLTEEYSIADQDKLLKIIKDFDKPTLFYLSKTDIIEKEKIDEFVNKRKDIFVLDASEITKKIIEVKK